MLFSTLTFIYVFLPALLLAYLLVPKAWRNGLLVFASLVFYAWGGVSYALIMVGSILINHLFGRAISLTEKPKLWLTVGIFFNVILLAVFKYAGFAVENVNALLGTAIAQPRIKLPLGISFFTFQQMSMLWDLHREGRGQRLKLSETALYVSLFPQLVAGPIVRFHDVIGQIRQRVLTSAMFHEGVQRFIIGLFKKVALANAMGALCDDVVRAGANEITSSAAWLGIAAYALQIFFDFSGYSDMAIGLGRMLGFRFLENFEHPYSATSIKEFWRRWHISLSTWFRDYVYIPLGGSRESGWVTYRNLIIVFFLTGLWHGASWNFVIWGLFHGLFLILERIGLERILSKLPKPLAWAYTMVVVLVGWVFFRIEHFADASAFIGRMFVPGGVREAIFFVDALKIAIFVVAFLLAFEFPGRWFRSIFPLFDGEVTVSIPKEIIRTFLLMAMLGYCTMMLAGDTFNPFIYFRF